MMHPLTSAQNPKPSPPIGADVPSGPTLHQQSAAAGAVAGIANQFLAQTSPDSIQGPIQKTISIRSLVSLCNQDLNNPRAADYAFELTTRPLDDVRKFPLLEIKESTMEECQTSSRQITRMLIQELQAQIKSGGRVTQELAFIAHQLVLASQLDPSNPQILKILHSFTKPGQVLMGRVMGKPLLTQLYQYAQAAAGKPPVHSASSPDQQAPGRSTS